MPASRAGWIAKLADQLALVAGRELHDGPAMKIVCLHQIARRVHLVPDAREKYSNGAGESSAAPFYGALITTDETADELVQAFIGRERLPAGNSSRTGSRTKNTPDDEGVTFSGIALAINLADGRRVPSAGKDGVIAFPSMRSADAAIADRDRILVAGFSPHGLATGVSRIWPGADR